MIETQRTITREVTLSGRGLHTGKECNLTFKPAPPGSWIVFRRTDLPGKPEIKATLDNVKEIARGTFLGRGDTEIKTVEHCLAAVSGLQIDNIIVEIDNEEVPVLDGSAKPFVDALLTAGFQDQGIPRDIFNIQDVIQYSQRDGDNVIDIHSIPYKDFRITFMVDYQKPLGTQYTTLRSLEEDFAENFAPARTFSFLSEVSTLFKMGLIKGGTLSNALVIADRPLTEEDISYMRDKLKIKGPIFEGENGFLNGVEPQFPNEPVRHKVVDLIGDLALLGFPIKGHIIAARSGHKSNIELAKLIRKQHDKWRISSKYRTISKIKTELLPQAKEAVELATDFATLGIVTTKTGLYSKELMEHFGLMHHFEVLIGREHVENPKPHAEPILNALKELDTKGKEIWMIGDTKLDLISAQNAGVNSIGVLSGYDDYDTLKNFTDVIFGDAYEAVKHLKSRKISHTN